jgi:hypothetical protein
VCDAPIGPGGNSRNEAVLFQREIRNQVVELKDEAYLVPEQAQQIEAAIDLDSIDRHPSAIGRIETAEQVEKRALAAARWTAERDGLAFDASKLTPFRTAIAPSS